MSGGICLANSGSTIYNSAGGDSVALDRFPSVDAYVADIRGGNRRTTSVKTDISTNNVL